MLHTHLVAFTLVFKNHKYWFYVCRQQWNNNFEVFVLYLSISIFCYFILPLCYTYLIITGYFSDCMLHESHLFIPIQPSDIQYYFNLILQYILYQTLLL